MNYRVDTSVTPKMTLFRLCLSCLSRIPASMSTCAAGNVSRVSPIICSKSCGLRWQRKVDHSPPMSSRLYSQSKKALEDLENMQNPYIDKYKEKFKQMQETSPEEFIAKVGSVQEAQIQLDEQRKKELSEQPSPKTEDSKTGKIPGKWPPKSLNEIMKVDLLKDLTAETIEQIWTGYHAEGDCVFGVVRENDYNNLMERVRNCPVFIYPLPRQDGYEFFLSQFSGKDVYYTPLALYQTQKENATSCLTVTHFTEFKEDKGIVLMAGQYDSNMLRKEQAFNLVKQLKMYYTVPGSDRFNLVRIFNLTPNKFHYQSLIDEYKKMKKYLETDQG